MKAYQQTMKFSKAVIYNFKPIRLPIAFYDSTGGPFDTVPMECWLELYDDEGVFGQCPCSSEMARLVLPLILTGESRTYEQWYDLVYWTFRNRGFSSESMIELGRLDIALHDIMAKRQNLPLHRFLGSTRDWVNVYFSGCGTGLTRAQMISEVEGAIKDGYTVFKMKVATRFGTDLDNDLARIKLVREMIGKHAKLAIDANQLWKAAPALEFAKKAAQYDIEWYEEPVHSHDMTELGKLAEHCPIPIAMGESMRNKFLYDVYVEKGAKHLQPIPTNLCGVRDWIAVRDLAKDKGLVLSSGGFSHLTASFIATAGEDAMVEYLYPILRYFYEVMELRPEEKDGKFILPNAPGICVSPNHALLESRDLIISKQYFYPAI